MDIQGILARYDTYLNEGRLHEAEQLLETSLQAAKDREEYGPMLTFYNEMEGLYRTTGRAEKAVEISDKALSLIADLGLTGHIVHATTLLNGATASRVAGKLEKALAMYRQAEQIFREQGQEKSYPMTALYNNISQVYQELGEPEQALLYQQQALAQIRALSDSEAEIATTQVSMSLSLMALKRLLEAEEMLEAAFAYYRSPAGASDPHQSSAFAAAGELACRRKEYTKAEECLQQALQLSLDYYGENDACRVIRQNLQMVQNLAGKTEG